MTAAGVVLVTIYLGRVGTALGRGGRRTLAARLGVAYPLARRFRTGMTLAMFAIIILTLVYMGEMSYMFQGRADAITNNLSGGFGVVLLSNPSNPVKAADLAQVPGVRRVAPLGYAAAEFTSPTRSRTRWPVTGVGPEVAAASPKLLDRSAAYPSDAAVWRAVTENPHLAIVDDWFLQVPGGPTAKAARIGDRIKMFDPVTGRSQGFTVAAIAENDFLLSGAYVGQDALTTVFRERAVPSRFFVGANDPDAAVSRIRTRFIANGADAETVHSVVSTGLSQNSGFFTLMQQFVGAGLIVGVAGIGVIMFRAVRERRREVGVLRSLGFPHGAVGDVFMFEAGFVATLGVALGVVIALIASYVLAGLRRRLRPGLPLRRARRPGAPHRRGRARLVRPRRARPRPPGVEDRTRGLPPDRRLNRVGAASATRRCAVSGGRGSRSRLWGCWCRGRRRRRRRLRGGSRSPGRG